MVKKIKVYKNFKINKSHKNSIIFIGNFDGLHIGHQKLFGSARKYKKKIKLGVVTFDPIPKMFFNKKISNYRLSNFNQKLILLKKFNVDFVINKKFDIKFSKIKAHNFIKDILFKYIKPKYIFVSNNFRFGNKREGSVLLLKKLEKKFNYKVVKPKPLIKNKKVISSSLIRKLLSQGKLNLVNKYLGRNWCVEGTVEQGRQMGKKMDFLLAI